MISIALLSEVLKEDINKNILSEFIIGEIYKNYKEDNVTIESISIGVSGKGRNVRKFEVEYNIYELMHLCKEWAFNQEGNYGWLVAKKYKNWKDKKFCCYVDGYKKKYMIEKTEPEVIFKACEWIMNNG